MAKGRGEWRKQKNRYVNWGEERRRKGRGGTGEVRDSLDRGEKGCGGEGKADRNGRGG